MFHKFLTLFKLWSHRDPSAFWLTWIINKNTNSWILNFRIINLSTDIHKTLQQFCYYAIYTILMTQNLTTQIIPKPNSSTRHHILPQIQQILLELLKMNFYSIKARCIYHKNKRKHCVIVRISGIQYLEHFYIAGRENQR